MKTCIKVILPLNKVLRHQTSKHLFLVCISPKQVTLTMPTPTSVLQNFYAFSLLYITQAERVVVNINKDNLINSLDSI